MGCPDENTFVALMERRLLPAEQAEVEAHVSLCTACRRLLALLSRTYVIDEAGPATTAMPSEPVAAETSHSPDAPLALGTRIGRYVVFAPLGRGAMGTLYTGYDPDLERKVAIKLIRVDGSGDLDAWSRFDEGKALARLSHPHVVSVYDVGRFDGGVFVAMELVEGETLRTWLRASPRGRREIVRTFLQAGQGLAAAHAAGLIHGDFKPENVLCGHDGRVRVTDFGLARTTSEGACEAGLVLLGTPAYMAPEQLQGRSADARSDQFAYCIALYEALEQRRPFFGDTVDQLATSIQGGPIRPRRMPSWLRSIVLRGLSPRPEDRHSSMAALLGALARSGAAARRWALAALVILLASTVALVARGHRQRAQLCRGEPRLQGIWDQSRKRTIREAFAASGKPYASDAWRTVENRLNRYAAEWSAMYGETCQASQPSKQRSQQPMLALRMACLEDRLTHLDALTTLFSHADAQITEESVKALHQLESLGDCKAPAMLEGSSFATDAPPDARALRAQLSRATALELVGKFEPALATAREVAQSAHLHNYRPLEAEALRTVGAIQKTLRDKAAEQTLNEALWLAEASRRDELAAEISCLLVELLANDGRLTEAEQQLRRAGSAVERLGGGDSSARANLLQVTGGLRHVQGRYSESAAAFRGALALDRELYGNEHHATASALLDLAGALVEQGQFEQALELEQESLSLFERMFGPAHPGVAATLQAIAATDFYLQRSQEAVPLLRRVLDISVRCYGPEHRTVATARATLGMHLSELGQHEEAIGQLEQAITITEHSFGKEHVEVAQNLRLLASAQSARGDHEAARRAYERALAIDEKAYGKVHPMVLSDLAGMGKVLKAAGKPAEAIPIFERALAMRARVEGPQAEVPYLKFLLAQSLWDAHRDRRRAFLLAQEAERDFRAIGAGGERFLPRVTAWLAGHGAP